MSSKRKMTKSMIAAAGFTLAISLIWLLAVTVDIRRHLYAYEIESDDLQFVCKVVPFTTPPINQAVEEVLNQQRSLFFRIVPVVVRRMVYSNIIAHSDDFRTRALATHQPFWFSSRGQPVLGLKGALGIFGKQTVGELDEGQKVKLQQAVLSQELYNDLKARHLLLPMDPQQL